MLPPARSPRPAGAPSSFHDVIVVGAGVVGCAIFRELVLAGQKVALIERGADILGGASKANSALLHTGFDATPGTLEAACVTQGYALYRDVHARLGLPLLETSAIVLAFTEADLAALPGIVARARENGVMDVREIGRDDVLAREPHVASDVLGGVLVPGEAVIDPWSAPLAYVRQGLANGGELFCGTELLGGELTESGWLLRTSGGAMRASVVINCTGNWGDVVEAIARPSPFEMRPRKGQFVVLDKTAAAFARHILLPVPNERTKGVVVCPTAFGNVLVGPTAEEQTDRAVAATDQAMLEALLAQGRRIVPALGGQPVTSAYAGLRPATQFKDYQIEGLRDRRWISVAGIRSTGLTGCLGIAKHVLALHGTMACPQAPLAHPIWPCMPNLTEALPRPWQQEARGEIVCHCEMVTAREIEAALAGPAPARDLGGLKRRTRCMMGRCQGFYCTGRVMELAGSRLPGLVAPIGSAA